MLKPTEHLRCVKNSRSGKSLSIASFSLTQYFGGDTFLMHDKIIASRNHRTQFFQCFDFNHIGFVIGKDFFKEGSRFNLCRIIGSQFFLPVITKLFPKLHT